MSDVTEAERLLNRFRTLTVAGAAFLIAFVISITALMLWQAYNLGQQARQLEVVAAETHDSLCTFKSDLKRRYDAGVLFLKEHPNGIPGISATDIERSLENQRATLMALSGLDCE